MRSWSFLLSRRWVGFALVVVLLATLAWWLGGWQFGRLEQRKERNHVFAGNVHADPVAVTDVLNTRSGPPASAEWMRVEATGTYAPEDTVIVRYQTRKSTSGVDLVVPFRLSDGTTLLVDRGWLLTRNDATEKLDLPDPPAGEVTIVGWVRADGTGGSTRVSASADSGFTTRAVSSVRIGEALDRPTLRGWVHLDTESPEAADNPLLKVELPDPGNGPHFFYGLQWWFFGLLAVGGFAYLAYDEWRGAAAGRQPKATAGRQRSKRTTPEGPARR